MKSKFIQTVLPVFVVLLLVALSVLSPVGRGGDGWIPLVGGFFNAELLGNQYLSVPLMVLCLAVTMLGMHMILMKTNAIPPGRSALLFLALLASNPYSLDFNQIYPVMACMVWAQFCLLERQVFVAYLLMSMASLFYAPVIWIVAVLLLLMPVNGLPDQFRVFVTSLAGACLPHLYLLVFRWIKFNDAGVYLYHFANEAIETGMPFHYLGLTDYFMILVVFYILFRSVSHFVVKGPKGFMEYMFRMNGLMVFVAFVLFILFGGNQHLPLLPLAFVPVSILSAYYFKSCEKLYRANIEYLVLMCSLVLCGLSHLMN